MSFDITELHKLFDLLLYFEGHINSPDRDSTQTLSIKKPQFTKTQITIQAAPIFAQKGIADTSVQDLLDAAQISRRTFYKYFRDKYEVLENIYSLSVNMFASRVNDGINEAESIHHLIEKSINSYFSYHESMSSMIRLMHNDSNREGSTLHNRRCENRDAFVYAFRTKAAYFGFGERDLFVYYSIYWIMENASIYLVNETECTREEVKRIKNNLVPLIKSILII